MEKKHQVFVSSTYKDLIEERKEVIHALLELDCIPAGMELFPATDESAWELITEVIDGCDYYLLILAGKYGSTNNDGIGYTEMEFDYAVSQKKPVICFLHEDLSELPASKVETTDAARKRLEEFREKARGKHCKFWKTPADLGGKASRSLIHLKKKHPSDGWVPGRYAADPKMLSEMERMRSRIVELEMQALVANDGPPLNIDELKHGSDIYEIQNRLFVNAKKEIKEIRLHASWDKIFAYCGPALASECSTQELLKKIELAYWHSVPTEVREFNTADLVIPYVCEDQILVQLQALGLMERGTKKRAVADQNTYWKLTKYGESYLIQIRALRRIKET